MATQHKYGAARFRFTPPGESEETHLLMILLWDIDPVDRMRRFAWVPVGERDRETVTVGEGVAEIVASIRFDDEPAALKRMLRLALRHDLTLTYQESVAGTEYPVRLMAVVGARDDDETPVTRDPDRTAHQAWMARLHLRRMDGGSLDDLL